MEDLLQIISNIGFPMAIAVYLLVRLEGKLDYTDPRLAGVDRKY